MLALLAMVVAASAAHADIRPVLRQQGFGHPLNRPETITYAGHVRQGKSDYQIYSYHGVFRAANTDHGFNALIVILNGSTFLGEYDIDDPETCHARGQEIVCKADYPGRVIRFTKHGPPYEIWIDGDVDQMTFGNRVKASRCNEHGCSYLEKWAHAPWWKMKPM